MSLNDLHTFSLALHKPRSRFSSNMQHVDVDVCSCYSELPSPLPQNVVWTRECIFVLEHKEKKPAEKNLKKSSKSDGKGVPRHDMNTWQA